jgi:hypothetical protein
MAYWRHVMKKNSVIVKTNTTGNLEFWTGEFRFSAEFPDARIVTCQNAKEIARLVAARFPGEGVQVIRNYGLATATGVMF